MHQSAIDNAQKFHEKYIQSNEGITVLDVGSADVHGQMDKYGSIRDIFSGAKFIGIDIGPGENVDMVYNGKRLPFDNDTFDVIVSTSCFEHSSTFWLTFQEMVRVIKPGGFIYLNAPSRGDLHRYPVDCYRFYADAWIGLAEWAGIELVEQYIDEESYWGDNIGIFRK